MLLQLLLQDLILQLNLLITRINTNDAVVMPNVYLRKNGPKLRTKWKYKILASQLFSSIRNAMPATSTTYYKRLVLFSLMHTLSMAYFSR